MIDEPEWAVNGWGFVEWDIPEDEGLSPHFFAREAFLFRSTYKLTVGDEDLVGRWGRKSVRYYELTLDKPWWETVARSQSKKPGQVWGEDIRDATRWANEVLGLESGGIDTMPKSLTREPKLPTRSSSKKYAPIRRARSNPLPPPVIQCQSLWEGYCDRPSKKRLKEVFVHLETMKGSRSKKVQEERRRCLRVANLEAKEVGLP